MEHIYSPIIKWKKGEKEALGNLTDEIKDKIVPIIELVSDGKSDMFYWQGRPFYLYIYENLYDNNLIKFNTLINNFHSKYLIPVISPNNSYDVIKNVISNCNNILAFRLKKFQLADAAHIINNFNNIITSTKSDIDVDLIIDLLDISNLDLDNKNISELSNIINDLNKLIKFRKIIISSTSIPKSIAKYPKNTIIVQDRYEVKLFNELSKKTNFNLIFSDYCTRYHEYKKINNVPIRSYFNIKYTINNKYLIIIDDQLNYGYKSDSVISICTKLISDERYCGKNYSFGDKYINDRHTICNKYGSAVTWITNSINHHITFVVNSI